MVAMAHMVRLVLALPEHNPAARASLDSVVQDYKALAASAVVRVADKAFAAVPVADNSAGSSDMVTGPEVVDNLVSGLDQIHPSDSGMVKQLERLMDMEMEQGLGKMDEDYRMSLFLACPKVLRHRESLTYRQTGRSCR